VIFRISRASNWTSGEAPIPEARRIPTPAEFAPEWEIEVATLEELLDLSAREDCPISLEAGDPPTLDLYDVDRW